MSVSVRTLADAQREISQLRNQLDTLLSKNINLSGRRIMNAGRSEHPHDLVRRDELTGENLAQDIIQNIVVQSSAQALPGNLAYVDKDNNFSTNQTFLRDIVFRGIGGAVGLDARISNQGASADKILQFDARLRPNANITLNIGESVRRWHHIFAQVLNLGTTSTAGVNLQTGSGDGPSLGLIQAGTNTISLQNSATAAVEGFYVGVNRIVGARITGWGAPTGTATRTTFATSTVLLAALAESVKALIDDLTTHGVIGA